MSGPLSSRFSTATPWLTLSKSRCAKCDATRYRPPLSQEHSSSNRFWRLCPLAPQILRSVQTKGELMAHNNTQSSADWLELVRQQVQGLRFGVVQILVHDSKVTQIERTERTRLLNGAGNSGEIEIKPKS